MITTFAFVIFAVGCMAGGWLLMRSVLGSNDSAKNSAKDTGTQVAKADTKNDTKKTDTSSPAKATEQVKATVAETKPATPPPETKPVTKMPETKPETPKPPETKPVAKVPDPPPDNPKPPDATVPVVFYDKDIRVIMESKCNRCHGDTPKPKGGLDTRTLAAIIKGGKEDGPGVTPGDLKKSSIWTSIEGQSPNMPPKGEPQLSPDQKKLIENWIKGGAKASATAAGPAPTPAPPAGGGAVLAYEKHVLPILTKKCGECHDSTNLKSGLDVTTLAGLKKGGKTGFPAVVAGDLKKSLLWEYIDLKQMPPEGSPALTAAETETIKNWIAMGAKDNKAAMVASAK
jgi:periplasmic protein TonB